MLFSDKVKTDEEQALGRGCQMFEFRHVKFEMPVKYPSNVVQYKIGYMHLEFRRYGE